MALEHYTSQDWKTTPNAMSGTGNSNGCFDCNICLDLAQEPVVTLCGHLYCWPCIYKWLHVQSSDSLAPDEHPQCPVCKADISHTTMVPLYGRGLVPANEKEPCCDVFIPPRPSASGAQQALLTSSSLSSSLSQSDQRLPYRNPYQGGPPLYQELDDATSSQMPYGSHHHQSVVGMVGEMVYARVFGNSDNLYGYQNSYQMMGRSNSHRLRRQEMQADKSLNRVSIFLFCCFLLCLIVF